MVEENKRKPHIRNLLAVEGIDGVMSDEERRHLLLRSIHWGCRPLIGVGVDQDVVLRVLCSKDGEGDD